MTPTNPATPSELKLAWLIERSDLDGASLHYAVLDAFGMGWTPNSNTATKFTTAADAINECNGGHRDGPLRVVEHGWHTLRQPTAGDDNHLHKAQKIDDYEQYRPALQAMEAVWREANVIPLTKEYTEQRNIRAGLAFAAAMPAPNQPAPSMNAKLTAEYLAMTPLQKWETLCLNGLIGTSEPWIEDMRQSLKACQPTQDGLREALEPVLFWYQSDECDERPLVDIVVDAVADLQSDRSEGLRMRAALQKIADAPAWGRPEKWETTPAEVRQLARIALSPAPCKDEQ